MARISHINILKKSVLYTCTIFTIIGTIITIAGVSLGDLFNREAWWVRGLAMLGIFIVFTLACSLIILYTTKRGVEVRIGGNNVSVKIGNLFKYNGIKVIPFNERFDTDVNEKIISSTSLNGELISNYISDIDELKTIIKNTETTSLGQPELVDNYFVYPLGTIKLYEDYALLAFTHFDKQNRANLSMPEYEMCLMNMWKELSRVYAEKPIYIPLLGAGITRFTDGISKSYDELLRCILCTLRATRIEFNSTITIVLTEQAISKMHLYDVKASLEIDL